MTANRKPERDNKARKSVRSGESSKLRSDEERPTGDNEASSVQLRPRRTRQPIGADGEIETFRGNGTEDENNESGNLALDVSFVDGPEMESAKNNKDSFGDPSDLDNSDSSLFSCGREKDNTRTVLDRPDNESNNDRDCIGVQSDATPIELPRTGDDNMTSKAEKRISIERVDANCNETDNDCSVVPLESSTNSRVLRNLKRDNTVDDSVTIIDNAVLTRKQSKDIELWIKGEHVDSDGNSEDSEISFKCSPAKQPGSLNCSPIKPPENSVKALNFNCDCGHNFTRRSSLTLHRKGSKCPINERKLNLAASASSRDIPLPCEKVLNNIEPKQDIDSVQCDGIQSTKTVMSKPHRSSLPLVRRGAKLSCEISCDVAGRRSGGPLMEVRPSQGKVPRGRRSVGVCEKEPRRDTSSMELDAQMSIADLLDSLTPTDDTTSTSKRTTKKRARSSSDVENHVNISKKTKLNSPKPDEHSKRDAEEENTKNGNGSKFLAQDRQPDTGKKVKTKRRSRSIADTPPGGVYDPALLKETPQEERKNDSVNLPAKRGRGRPRKIRESDLKSPDFESGPVDSGGDNIPGAPKTIAQEMMEAIQANMLTSVSDDEKPYGTDADVKVPRLSDAPAAAPAPKRKRGRPPKLKVSSTADTICAEDNEMKPRKQSSGSENSLISPRSSSSSSQSNRTKSRKLVQVMRRRTKEFVKKSIARAKANLYSTKEGNEKMFACTCGGLYTQKQSVMRHQQNSDCPVQSFSDITQVFVEKVEKPVRERKFVCSCGRAFTQSSSMQRHQKNTACPFISAAVFNTNTSPRKRRRRKKSPSTLQSTDAENTQATPKSTVVALGDVSKDAQSMNASDLGDKDSSVMASGNDAQSVNKDGDNNSAESDEEFVTGKRVDYSLKASYICSCNETFKFHGSIRRHQKHSKCVGIRRVVRGTRKDARKNPAPSAETDDNINKSDMAEGTKKKSLHPQENIHIKEDPDKPEKITDGHRSGSVPATKSSKVERRRRISSADEGVTNKKRTSSSSVHDHRSPRLNVRNRNVAMKKQKPMKRLQRQVNVPGYYFPCQCGRKYRHKRDLCTHQKRSATCPRNSRYTIPVYYSLSQLKRTHSLSRAKQEMYIAMEQNRETSDESETTTTTKTAETTSSNITENSSPRKQRTPRGKQTERVKLEVNGGVASTAASPPEKECKQRKITGMDCDGDVKKDSIGKGKDPYLDVRAYIRCKCGSSFTRIPSLNRHWKESCTTVSDKDKQRIIAEIRKVLPLRRRGRERKDINVVSTKIHSKARNLVMKAKNMAVQNASKKTTKLTTRRMPPARKRTRIKKRKLGPGFANLSDPPGLYPCPCGKTYRYRRDLQSHQRRSEKCPKTAWINKAKIEEYGQAPEHVKESLALISKWKAERDGPGAGETPPKAPIVTVAEKEEFRKSRGNIKSSKNKHKRDSPHDIVKSIDRETKRAEKTVKLENIVEELTTRRDDKTSSMSRRSRHKRDGRDEVTDVYPCTCGRSYTHREILRKHLCRSLCSTTSYVRKLLNIRNDRICMKSEGKKHSSRMRTDRAVTRPNSELVSMRPIVDRQTPVKTLPSLAVGNNSSSPVKLEPFEEAVFAIGLDLVNKECGGREEQKRKEEVAISYRAKRAMRKPVKRLVGNANKKFRCNCGKEFKHRSSLYTHRRLSPKCRDTMRTTEGTPASQTPPTAKPHQHDNDTAVRTRMGDSAIESETTDKKHDQDPELNINGEAEKQEIKPDEGEVVSNRKATLRSVGKFSGSRSASIVSKNLVKKSIDDATKRRIERIEERKLGPYICPCGKEYTLVRALQRHQKKSKSCPKTAWKIVPGEMDRGKRTQIITRNTTPLDTNNNGTVSEDDDRLSSKDLETQTEGNEFRKHLFCE